MNFSVSNIFNVSLILTLLSNTAIASDFSNNKRPYEHIESETSLKRLYVGNNYCDKPFKELVELANSNDKKAQYTIIHNLNDGLYSISEIQNSNIQLNEWHPFNNANKEDSTYWKLIIYKGKITPSFTKMIQELAQQDNLMALYSLGLMYYHGVKYTVNFNKAFEYYKKAADKGYPEAQYYLGQLYSEGKGTEIDLKKAFEYVKKSADQGYPEAQQTLALLYFNGNGIEKDINKALEYYQKAADQGCLQSQHNLGLLYFNNEGTDKDLKKAFENCQNAADQGNLEAQYQLGQFYFNGKVIKRDLKKAFEYFQKAAHQGHMLAQYMLGETYFNGFYTQKNYVMAFRFFQKAANQGNRAAQYQLGSIYYNGLGTKKNYKKSIEYFHMSADQGHREAQYQLGRIYYSGVSTKTDVGRIDFKKAFEYFQKATNQGHLEAQYYLGTFYKNGYGVREDLNNAFEYFQKAADQGHQESQLILGTFYKDGKGIQKDFNKAWKYFRQAADQGMEKAEWAIGQLYEIADGIEKNLSKAIEMYMKASKRNQPDAIKDVNRFLKISKNNLPKPQGIESSIKSYREAIHTFKLSHAMAAQEWKFLIKYNNPNSGFENDGLQINYLYKPHKDLIEIYYLIDLIADRLLDPCFMINCVQFINHEFNDTYHSSSQDYIKRYNIIPKDNSNACVYTTFGIKNIKYNDIITETENYLNSNESFQTVKNFHINTLNRLKYEALLWQIHSNNAGNETENNSQNIHEITAKIAREESYIMYLNELKNIPRQLMDLAVKGTMIRNHLFSKEYEHIERI